RVCQTGVGAAQVLGHAGQAHGQLAHVRLVDHALVAGGRRGSVVPPVEAGVEHHAAGDEGGGVQVARRGRVVGVVGQDLRPVDDVPLDGARVRVEQHLGG